MSAPELIQALLDYGYSVVKNFDEFRGKTRVLAFEGDKLVGISLDGEPRMTAAEVRTILEHYTDELKYLSISWFLPEIFDGLLLPKLTYLSLARDNIQDLDFLSCCPNLQILSIDSEALRSLRGIEKLKNLQCLKLEDGKVRSLSRLKKLKHLACLKVSSAFERIKDWTILQQIREFAAPLQIIKQIPINLIKSIPNLKIASTLLLNSPKQLKELDLLQNLSNITELEIYIEPLQDGLHIADVLAKLSNFKNLESLSIKAKYDVNVEYKEVEVEDLSLLQAFKKLTYLYLELPMAKDLNVLGELTNLKELWLLVNFEYKAKQFGLTFNHSLDFVRNLDNLEILHLQGFSRLKDLSFLIGSRKLKELYFVDTVIDSLSGIEYLHSLRRIDFYFVKASDLTGLRNLKNLEVLNINWSTIDDYSELQFLTNLRELQLLKDGIYDFSFLRKLKSLEVFETSDNYLFDFSVLRDLKNLRILRISNDNCTGKYKNVHILVDITRLANLELSSEDFSIEDFPLDKLKNLKFLTLKNFNNSKRISKLTQLRELVLNAEVKDISFVKNLENLTMLSLETNKEVDLTPLSNLKNLVYLDLNEIDAQYLELIATLPNLRELYIRNVINAKQAKTIIERLQSQLYDFDIHLG